MVLASALFAVLIAWIAYNVLCEEGCVDRPWTLHAQLVLAVAGLVPAALTATAIARGEGRGAWTTGVPALLVYAAWALLLAAAT